MLVLGVFVFARTDTVWSFSAPLSGTSEIVGKAGVGGL